MTPLTRLGQIGALRTVDVEFGSLLARLDERGSESLALVAAAASQAIAQGHSCLPLDALGELLSVNTGEPLRIALPDLTALRATLAASPLAADVDVDSEVHTPLVWDGSDRIWLRRYADYERRVAAGLIARARRLRPIADAVALRARFAHWFQETGTIEWQAIAVALGLRAHLAIISGGPGTGKTTSVLWLLIALLEEAVARGAPLPRIRLAAPTGKAAARLGEAIGERKAGITCSDAVRAAIREDESSTLHRLLGYRPRVGFRHNRDNPVAADIVVVDEASMVDLPLMAHLLDALRDDTALILLGDVGQLASVEAGHVLASIGASGTDVNRYSVRTADDLQALTGYVLPRAQTRDNALSDAFVELQHSHRFSSDSGIGLLARAIRGDDAEAALAVLAGGDSGVEWHGGDRAQIMRALREHWIARFRGIGSAMSPQHALVEAARFRILTALREGPFGCVALNRAIENAIGDGTRWYQGRLVMVTTNDYRRKLFNGDMGVAWQSANGRLEVWFPGEGALRAFAPFSLPAHEPAFATTVHKSQGSEFDDVAVVLPDVPNRVLGRELLYTAVTRARESVAVYGDETIIRATVARRIERWSGLPELLRAS